MTRNDDRITLSNGEKVLPIPYEGRLRLDSRIHEALLFGSGKALPGLFIIPSGKAADMEKDAFVDSIWPVVQAANANAERFGHVAKEMIEVLDANVDCPSTDKGTMIREASYKRFAPLIEGVYRRFEEGDGEEKLERSQTEIEDFLLHTFKEKADTSLEPDTDFFSAGIDSLQAITVRAAIKRTLSIKGHNIRQNIIYEKPTIKELAAFLYGLQSGLAQEAEDEISTMSALISKYSYFEQHRPVRQETILLSGTTGSLGAHILAQLLQQQHVKRIYCPVRAESATAAYDRVVNTLHSKGLLPLNNLNKIIALPSDFSKADIGFPTSVIADLKSTLTRVIHSAWAVNFNMGVRSFEHQHIRSVHNLINLSLAVTSPQPAEFYFCSSISAAAGTPLPATIAEAPVPDLSHAQNMGYARSKLVAEKITQHAAGKTGMTAKVLRIGQIIGDSRHGIWNTTEAIPLMLRSAVTMKALPALDETPSWTPVDVVAGTVLDLTGISGDANQVSSTLHDAQTVYHIQNPRLFHWTRDLLPALRKAGLDFETVSQREWIRRLRESSDSDPIENPTIKLLDFFARKYDNDGPARKGLVFETRETERASPTLRGGFDVIGSGIIEKIVRQWRNSW